MHASKHICALLKIPLALLLRSLPESVHELVGFSCEYYNEVHEEEILCLCYSPATDAGHLLLASAGRDRLIHLFDVSAHDYRLVHSMDEHTAAITAVTFAADQQTSATRCISSGADKSVIFRHLSCVGSCPTSVALVSHFGQRRAQASRLEAYG